MQGLHKKADVEKFYAQKGETVPEGLTYSDGKGAKKANKKKEKNTNNTLQESREDYGKQGELF